MKKNYKIKDRFRVFIIVIFFLVIIKAFAIECIQIDGNSMYSTLRDGEILIINKFTYNISKPKRGDIILFRCQKYQRQKLIKRVIAIEGDTIEIINGEILVNNIVIKESYIFDKTLGDFYKRVVPTNTLFVLGDNRNNSKDSRFEDIGFIPLDFVKGKGCFVIWAINNFRRIK